ncbi:MAG: hypothetical protein PHE36_00685 [Novosphingobium sp.]|nr:hypothetical protein [Novosphingobium sp.]
MFRLMSVLFSIIGTTLMGIGIVVVLVMGLDTWKPILLAAVAGFLVAIPVSWFISRAILKGQTAP